MKSPTATLLCWHSHGKGMVVLEESIKRLENKRVKVGRVVYLVQDLGGIDVPHECQGASVDMLSLPIDKPTNHSQIYEVVSSTVVPRVRDVTDLHINVSPGTPAMHAVWLVLHAGGAFPHGTKLWSSQRAPKSNRTRLDPVDFSISTYLAEIRDAARVEPEVAVYEPEAKSAARRHALEKLGRYAKVIGAPLLVLGERGTGKTRLVEKYVSRLKNRGKVVSVPCGGLDQALAESMLFGHTEGAFTGADRDRPGLLAEAESGILFLDEVQDLPRQLQRKLVRVFQDRKRLFRPVGSDGETSVDAELVCASNLPLDALVGKLDADLFDRLSHLIVEIPPLRDCRNDIRDDWERVWAELRASDDFPSESPWTPALEAALKGDELTGNLRDLQRLATLIMAWTDGYSTSEATDRAISEWKTISAPPIATSFHRFGHGTRDERKLWFLKELALWAKGNHGTWVKAAASLGCAERTLRKDAST